MKPVVRTNAMEYQQSQQQREVVKRLLKGDLPYQVISHPGTSQYAQGEGRGVSACGLAALNCARCLLEKASRASAAAPDAFLHDLFARETIDEVTSICDSWPSDLHLEVDHIYEIPLFQQSLDLVKTKWDGKPGFQEFRHFLSKELASNTSLAAVITRPPEIVTCIKFLIGGKPIFLVFDSHPRTAYPDGAAFIVSTSIDAMAEHLNRILAFDPGLLGDEDMQWQVQLMAQFSAHIFRYKPQGDTPAALMDIVVKSSLAVLEMRANITRLESQNKFLSSENSRLETEVDNLNDEVKRSRRTGHRSTGLQNDTPPAKAVTWANGRSGSQFSKTQDTYKSSKSPSIANSILNRPSQKRQASESSDLDTDSSSSGEDEDTSSNSSSYTAPPLSDRAAGKQRRIEWDDLGPVESQKAPAFPKVSYASVVAGPSRSKHGSTAIMSQQRPNRLESLDPQSQGIQDLFVPPHGLNPSEMLDFEYAACQQHECDKEAARLRSKPQPGYHALASGGSPLQSRDFEYAARQQREYDEEHLRIRAEKQRLSNVAGGSGGSPPRDFVDVTQQPSLGPSHGEKAVFSSASLPGGDDHERAVLQQLQFDEEDQQLRAEQQELTMTFQQKTFHCGICLEICAEDSVFRVSPCSHNFCRSCIKSFVSLSLREHRFPILCPACTVEDREPSAIDNLLAQQVGMSDEENDLWRELELVTVSVMLHCRKCTRTAFVDRQEYDDMKLIPCPLPHCTYLWCKSCQHEVPFDGPPHSCDGSSELDHLMKKKGWKYCPGCKTPIQKVAGCNHMKCMSPGCNIHFCYVCGQEIIRSSMRNEIQTAVTRHYQKCQLFEDVGE